MYLSRQLYEEALHVQFYLTLLDTYVPDPDERAARVRGGREHPVDPQEGRVLHALDRLDPASSQRLETRERPAAVPAEPHLLRGVHRGAVLLRRVRLRLLPALARACSTGSPAGTNWVFRDESAHMAFAFEVVATVRREEPELFDAELEARRRADDRRGDRLRDAVRRGPARRRRRRALGRATCGSTSSTAPISASRRSACAQALRREEPVRASWTCRTCRR